MRSRYFTNSMVHNECTASTENSRTFHGLHVCIYTTCRHTIRPFPSGKLFVLRHCPSLIKVLRRTQQGRWGIISSDTTTTTTSGTACSVQYEKSPLKKGQRNCKPLQFQHPPHTSLWILYIILDTDWHASIVFVHVFFFLNICDKRRSWASICFPVLLYIYIYTGLDRRVLALVYGQWWRFCFRLTKRVYNLLYAVSGLA